MNKQIKDQLGHFVGAIIVLTLPIIGLLGYILAGFTIGFIREQGQAYVKVQGNAWKFWDWEGDAWLDIVFWTLGGLVAGLLIL